MSRPCCATSATPTTSPPLASTNYGANALDAVPTPSPAQISPTSCAACRLAWTKPLMPIANASTTALTAPWSAIRRAREGAYFVYAFPQELRAYARVAGRMRQAARFELIVDGVELANGYHEIVDSDEQRHRFEDDNVLRRQRGLAAMAVDQDWLQAGLPACAGVAVGARSVADAAPRPLGDRRGAKLRRRAGIQEPREL